MNDLTFVKVERGGPWNILDEPTSRLLMDRTEVGPFALIIQVNKVGARRFEEGETLSIGSRPLNRVWENLATVRELTREDLDSVFVVSKQEMPEEEDEVKRVRYTLELTVDWIARVELDQKMYPC